jgi:hypothetical protein
MLLDIVLGFSFFSFHADLKRKGPLIFGFQVRWTNSPRRTNPPRRTSPPRRT